MFNEAKNAPSYLVSHLRLAVLGILRGHRLTQRGPKEMYALDTRVVARW